MVLWMSQLETTTQGRRHIFCYNYPSVNQALEIRHIRCWPSNWSNTTKVPIQEVDKA